MDISVIEETDEEAVAAKFEEIRNEFIAKIDEND